jgi:uncharacterized protein (PEP-CTERM system associated)
MATAPLQAQSTGSGRVFYIQPQLSVTETLTNNVELSPNQPISDAVTDLAAGISLRSSSGRVRGALDYTLSEYLHARHSELNTRQNTLNANLGADLVEGRARVDVVAAIKQTAISAFGVQPGVGGQPASNLTESRTISISPSFNGPLGSAVRYSSGLGYSIGNARGGNAGDVTNLNAFVSLGPERPGVVAWSVDLSSLQTDYNAGRRTVDNHMLGSLSRKIDALDLTVKASAGVEVTDLTSVERLRYETWGIGATWIPSPRTTLQAQYDERFFGNSHTLRFEHRTALTTWTFSDSRSLSTNSDGTKLSGQGATFDLYYSQFASIEPDPVKRTEFVNNYLKSNGLSASTGNVTGYLRSSATVVRDQNAAVAYRGSRGAAVLSINRSVTTPVENAALPSQDFIGTANVVKDAIALNLSHRLTPTSSVNLGMVYDKSHGDRPQQFSSQRQMNLQYASRLSAHTDLVLGARRSLYKNYETPFNEAAVFATYGIRF